MEIFSSNPSSFKMDRRSPQASKLKETVAKKLFDFLGNYSDDVLAEYIVVLVCNGKHQNQARDDLEAFLGDESGEFVAWLWDHLVKNVSLSKTPSGLSNLKEVSDTRGCDDDVERKQGATVSKDLQNDTSGTCDLRMSKDGKKFVPATFSHEPIYSDAVEVSEDFERWCPGVDAPLNEVNAEEVRAQIWTSEIPEERTHNSHNEAVKYGSSRERSSPGISAGGEQCPQYENQYNKIVISNYNGSSHPFLNSPKEEKVLSNLQSVVTENPESRPLSTTNGAGSRGFSRAMDTARPRGNVWDRLGKPCEDKNIMVGDKIYSHGIDIIKRRKMEQRGEGLDKQSLMVVVPDGKLNRKLMGEIAVLGGKVIPNTLNDAGNSGRKRQLGETGSGNSLISLPHYRDGLAQDKEVFQRLKGSSSDKYNNSQGLNNSDSRSSDCLISEVACKLVKSPNAAFNPGPSKISQGQMNREASVAATTQTPVTFSSSLLAKSDSRSHAESGHANHNPVKDEVFDVKLRLRQIEMEMSKLRSKQADMNNGSKLNGSLGSGAQNHFEDDIESRTIFVTNVHFAATKEALSSHFSKCGVVVKTILLTDTVTAQPKGDSFVVFASKESADKAITLNGTSFFSRTLKDHCHGSRPGCKWDFPIERLIQAYVKWLCEKQTFLLELQFLTSRWLSACNWGILSNPT
ncbi:RNA binding (RRM/RBD/RNP motifs) family protein isoform X2 [Tasmannia lanceolata]|uniref:RNA binding (RRM/RBD/RNP motifs) family protein isoform X2 n=1 Tax=Tasmannia lanceolata TaxID=3420 RepID=UPI00406441FF